MAPKRTRLDAELVRRKMTDSRERAQHLIAAGSVYINGVAATKPATQVEQGTSLAIREAGPQWASRGAHKLLGALQVCGDGVVVQGARCLDAGASTGGFTDVLLSRGAREVVAVDVGYGQLAWRLQNDPRVAVHDKTNVRTLTPEVIGGEVDVTVSDLSFISLTLVLAAMARCTRPGGHLLPMVKPQFEVGKQRLGTGGVVRDPQLRAAAVEHVARTAEKLGLTVQACAASPLPGPSGNVEYFLWLQRPEKLKQITVEAIPEELQATLPEPRAQVAQAVAKGPQ